MSWTIFWKDRGEALRCGPPADHERWRKTLPATSVGMKQRCA
jgi:hypothetical protein